ncbi:MAG: hypothetical protein A3K75_05280 [Euryarchaeota archaeon RBG_13_61_15]|nr:MAG: hypothetical protein A3K75_05280 [Euryarchaeota archaeon RBG_13_61_15]
MEEAVSGLSRLGLNEYESRAYAALVGLGEGTARQIHEASGVPRPRVYDIIESLASKGFVEVGRGTPLCYRAVEPLTVISKLRKDFEDASKDVMGNLDRLRVEAVRKVSPVWYIRGEWSIRSRLSELVDRASEELQVLCARPGSLKDLAAHLSAVSSVKSVTCIVTEGASSFRGRLGKARLFETTQDCKTVMHGIFKSDLLTSRVDLGGASYRMEYLIVADGRESMMVYEANGERTAVVIELPFVTHLQQSLVQRIAEDSKEIP